MLKTIDSRGMAPGLGRGEFREFRVLLAFAMVLFFCIAALSRVLPRAWRPLASKQGPTESVFEEAKRTAYTVIPYAFMR